MADECRYCRQGTSPLSRSMTLGLPIIRTSVDYGTGFGRAGDGNVNERSPVNDIDDAVLLAACKDRISL